MCDLTICWRANLKLVIPMRNQRKCEIVSESSILKKEIEGDNMNSEPVMVPSGNYFYLVCSTKWTKILENIMLFRSVGMELKSHRIVDFMVQQRVFYQTSTQHNDISINGQRVINIIVRSLASYSWWKNFGPTPGLSSVPGNRYTNARFVARREN